MNFSDFNLHASIMQAIEKSGYEKPTLIQEQVIPFIMEGKDILGCAQTGTGKTAAFALPILDGLLKEPNNELNIKALILTPTRELAMQIRDNFRQFGGSTPLKCSVIFGGVNQNSQVNVLKKGVDILVATPGRLLDLINQKYVKLDKIKYLVLDEADMMLDMGFLHDVKKIMSFTNPVKQTLLFSATMPKTIEELSSTLLKNPSVVKVTPVSSTVKLIEQKLYYVDKKNKASLLIDILKKEDIKSALIFCKTKHGANKLGEILEKAKLENGVIHGNKSQNARVQVLRDFKAGRIKILIATDIAARGIDIEELSHVFNYDMPDQAETYVHRIGRTGRANLSGKAVSFANIDEKYMVKDIERLIKESIPVITEHNYPMVDFVLTPKVNSRNGGRKNNSFSKDKKETSNNNGRTWNNDKNNNRKDFGHKNNQVSHTNFKSNRGK
ncbi:MAG: DEAD/DEAH box helicase [Bacilli bacterium]